MTRFIRRWKYTLSTISITLLAAPVLHLATGKSWLDCFSPFLAGVAVVVYAATRRLWT